MITMEEQDSLVLQAKAIWEVLNLESFDRHELSALMLAAGTRIGQIVRDAGEKDETDQHDTITRMCELYAIQLDSATAICGLPINGSIDDMKMDEQELAEFNDGKR